MDVILGEGSQREEGGRMSKVTVNISMSLDGFITGPNESVENPLGDGGERLHERMFDEGVEPWGDPPPFGMPVFVLTHEAREPQPMQGGTTYTFVSDGRGRPRAGPGRRRREGRRHLGRSQRHQAVSESRVVG
jgi:hypothetical protein